MDAEIKIQKMLMRNFHDMKDVADAEFDEAQQCMLRLKLLLTTFLSESDFSSGFKIGLTTTNSDISFLVLTKHNSSFSQFVGPSANQY